MATHGIRRFLDEEGRLTTGYTAHFGHMIIVIAPDTVDAKHGEAQYNLLYRNT
jgi:hypothetical protein